MQASYSSRLLDEAVEQFATLPGIGRKTALRLVLHLLKQEDKVVETFGTTILKMKSEILSCKSCHNISDNEICPICSDPYRDQETVCVVESIRDVISVENTQQFRGVYHVLGGNLSVMSKEQIGRLKINELITRSKKGDIKEVVVATNPTTDGETTALYLARVLKPSGVKVTRIARGMPTGGDIEYADEITLSSAMDGRKEI